MTEIPELWTPERVAPMVHETPYWLKNKARKGLIPFHRHGRAIMFTPDDVVAIIENGAVPVTSTPARSPRSRRKPAAKVTKLRSKPVDRNVA